LSKSHQARTLEADKGLGGWRVTRLPAVRSEKNHLRDPPERRIGVGNPGGRFVTGWFGFALWSGAFCSFAQSGAPARATDLAVTFQINARHTGAIITPSLLPPLTVKWSVDLGAAASYPLIAEKKVFVLAGDSTAGDVNLYALDINTGGTVWGPILIPVEASFFWAAATYDNGMIFVVPGAVSGLTSGALYAYDAKNGQQLWSTTLPGQVLFSSPPTARNGIVYTAGAGNGGTLYAVSETDGRLLWTASVLNGDNSSPVVTSGGVYVSYACPQTYKFEPKGGAQIWHLSGPCSGGGGNTPALYRGGLYVRGSQINSDNGAILSALKGTALKYFNSQFPPAFFHRTAYYVEASALTAVDVTTGSPLWTAVPANGDSYSSGAVVVNGTAYVGTQAGNLLGYTPKGRRVVSLSLGTPILGGDAGGLSQPQAGLGAGQGLLVVPAGTKVFALAPKP
jgi:outer membrane protein assembly factor BamB